MTKTEARQHFKQLRRVLSELDCIEKSRQITDRFFTNVDLSDCRVLHIFLSMAHLKEVDTTIIIDRIKANFPSIKIVVPAVNETTQTMRCLLLTEESEVELSNLKIPEPSKNKWEINPREIDVVVVPLLAADERGHRVGYGKGFYDKFLMECRPEALKVGLSFFDPIKKISDTELHDIALNVCISPKCVFYFTKGVSA